jgi:hypothetical protein
VGRLADLRARAVALLLTLSLHILLVAPSLSGGGGPGASARSSGPALTVIELAGSNARSSAALFSAVHLQRLKLQSSDLDVGQGDAVPIAQDDSAPEYVRRMAALTARIQGLWKLPRTRLTADFHCRARLRPGEAGSIDEVELESCDDSGPLRASIAQAIEHAMPLSLPQERPGAAVDIVLQFIAYAEASGASHTSIEPAAN